MKKQDPIITDKTLTEEGLYWIGEYRAKVKAHMEALELKPMRGDVKFDTGYNSCLEDCLFILEMDSEELK